MEDPFAPMEEFTHWVECQSYLTKIPPDTFVPGEPESIDPRVPELLEKGIKCLEEDKNEEAIKVLSEAIEIEPKHSLPYMNRAAAYARLKNFKDALEDCETMVELRPDWPEANWRKGTVLMELYRHRHAHCAFTKSYDLEPTNEKYAKAQFEALLKLQTRVDKPWPPPDYGPLSDKTMIKKLWRHPLTRHIMLDPGFPEIIEEIRRDPSAQDKYMGNDDYKVGICAAVVHQYDVNQGEIDYQDLMYPEKHKKLLERFGGSPWVPDYSPVREIYIPPPPPPKKEKPRLLFPFFELDKDFDMPSDYYCKPDLKYLKKNKLSDYKMDLLSEDIDLSSFK